MTESNTPEVPQVAETAPTENSIPAESPIVETESVAVTPSEPVALVPPLPSIPAAEAAAQTTPVAPVTPATPVAPVAPQEPVPVQVVEFGKKKMGPGLGIGAFVLSLVVLGLAVGQWLVLRSANFVALFSFLSWEDILMGDLEGIGDSAEVAVAALMNVLVTYITLVGIQWIVGLIGTILACIALFKKAGFWWAVASICVGITGIGLAAILSGLFGLV